MRRRPVGEDTEPIEFEPRDLVGLFSAPRWLRDLGFSAWLAVGVTVFLVGAVWILSLTHTIVTPVITAAVVAAVASPLVTALEQRGASRGLATVLLLLAFVALIVLVALVMLGGVQSQAGSVKANLDDAQATITGWLTDIGVSRDAAANARDDIADAVSSALPALLEGVASGLRRLSSLVVFIGLTLLSTFFLLKDGPLIRTWAEGHMRVPPRTAHGITQRVLQSLRGYFVGVTFVAAFNAIVVGFGAVVLGVPLAGTIAAVTFLGAYIPYFGAWGAGAFSVLIALGGAGPEAAVGMIVVQVLANGALQQLIQPVVYGAALGIHPLAVLLVTIAGGSLFGAVGLILAAPLTAAATRVSADLARRREETDSEGAGPEWPGVPSPPEEPAVP
jgi:predicted PurR-regulated permease PerM